MRVVIPLLLFALSVGAAAAADALSGRSFSCNGALLGFDGHGRLVCPNPWSPGTLQNCGSYSYDGANDNLSGDYFGQQWTATDLQLHKGILYAFSTPLAPCMAVALDYMSYSSDAYFGAACPTQNAIPSTSYEDNHVSLGQAGDIAIRSKLEIVTGSGNTIVRDSYGVYTLDNDGTLTMMFGAQQGRPAGVVTGRLDANGVYLDAASPPGPCTWDGSSAFRSPSDLMPRRG